MNAFGQGSEAGRTPDHTQLPDNAPRHIDRDGESREATSRGGLRDRDREARLDTIALGPNG